MPQKPNTCRSQRPSPDGISRSQMPSRPNSCAVSSSSSWRAARAASARWRVTSASVQTMRPATRAEWTSTQNGSPAGPRNCEHAAVGALRAEHRARTTAAPRSPCAARDREVEQRRRRSAGDSRSRRRSAALAQTKRAGRVGQREHVAAAARRTPAAARPAAPRRPGSCAASVMPGRGPCRASGDFRLPRPGARACRSSRR